MTRTPQTLPTVRKDRTPVEFTGKVPSTFEPTDAAMTRVWGLAFWLVIVGFGFFGSMVYLAATSPMPLALRTRPLTASATSPNSG